MAQAISGTSAKRHAIRASMVWAVLIIVRVLDPMLKAVTQSLVDASASPVSVVSVFFSLALFFSFSVD